MTEKLTHWKKLTNPNYLGAYSLDNGKDAVLTIKEVRREQVVGADGKREECTVCYFSDADKPMILNKTNCKQIEKLLATPYIEQWTGHKIQIGAERVRAFGDTVDALRVRAFLPQTVTIKCESCGAEISASNRLSASQLAAYTLKKYGAKLCAECATKAAEEGKK